MRRFALPLAFLIGIYLDSILFCRLNIGGIRPDALLVVIVSAGVLLGSVKAGIMGVGLNAIAYMVAGVTGGLFYQKFYADNVVVPAMVAAVSALLKEHIMMLAVRISGGTFSYFEMLGAYVLPCMLLTVALTMPVHVVLKRALARQVRTEHRAGRA